MKKYLLGLILLACSILAAESWTVLVYMAADNNLEYNARGNLNEMESVSQPAGLNLIVQADFASSGAKRYRIRPDNAPQEISSPVLENLGELDSGDPAVLREFLIWGRQRFPAEHYMLVIWAHADSWYKQSKWISPDYDSGNAIGVANGELKQALQGLGLWDILLFDACSMQGVEIITEIKDFASFIVASADEVPATGFPYSEIIPLLDQNPAQVAAQIPDLYAESYSPGGIHNPSMGYLSSTCSAISTAGFDAFIRAWKDFSAILRNHAATLFSVRQELFEMNTGYADVDLRQLLMRLSARAVPEAAELLQQWDTLVLASAYTLPYPETGIGTAAIWYPDFRHNYNAAWQHYMQLEFAKTGWLGVVNLSLGAPFNELPAPTLLAANVILNRLNLRFAAPPSADALYYHLRLDERDFILRPMAYASELTFSAIITDNGTYSISAIDQTGQISLPLNGSYSYTELEASPLMVIPNPVREAISAKLLWKHSAGEVEQFSVAIYNLRGQRVLQQNYHSPIPEGELHLMDLEGFAALKRGIYIIRLRINSQQWQCKLSIL